MYYKKPNIRYVDMAIYIDNNIYREDLTEEDKNTIFIYMYHLARMLATKEKLFKSSQYYDDFSIYMATFVYLRYLNKKQFEYDDNGIVKMTKLKSVLNYMKRTLRVRKIDFEQTFYSQTLSKKPDVLSQDVCYNTQYSLACRMADEVDKLKIYNFEEYFDDIPYIAREFLNKIPYSSDKVMIENIYISCILTLLNSITIRNSIKKIRKGSRHTTSNIVDKNDLSKAILFHLPDSMSNYILILTREIKHIVAKSISADIHSHVSPSDLFENVILEELGGDSLVNKSSNINEEY